ncbi:MAG: VanZ family protein [Actinobacteria bacterium]|nr:VanZ family protein [Actinomycetota bacterium]
MNRRGWLRAISAVLAVGAQTLALYWPRPPSGPQTSLPLDKFVHVLLFAVPTFALLWAGLGVGWVVLIMTVQLLASEAIQSFMPTRSAELGDLVADLLGVLLGLVCGWWLLLRRPEVPDG